MSFSSEVKEELSKLNNLANKEVVKYELLGYLVTNHITIEKSKIKFSTENEYNINRFGKLISNIDKNNNYEIAISGKSFYITANKIEINEINYKDDKLLKTNKIVLNCQIVKQKIKQDELCAKAFVRGVFLGSGSVNNPKSTYHLEMVLISKENVQIVEEILNQYKIPFKILEKKSSYSLYTKDGDEISKFLALIGASKAVLKFEEIRVYRDIRNNVNRKVNCETANLNKTINTAVKQISDIRYLQKIGEFQNLTENLKQIAIVRIENPEGSLQELGKMLDTPIGKSGVNHRLKAIQKIAEENRNKRSKKKENKVKCEKN